MVPPRAIHIVSIGAAELERYARVPICFTVSSILRVEAIDPHGLGGLRLVEEPVDPPYLKNYDDQELPTDWPSMFDVRNWGFFLALPGAPDSPDAQNALVSPDAQNALVSPDAQNALVSPDAQNALAIGAAAVAFNTAGVHMLEGRPDLAVLWDLRVHPDARGQGVGRALFRHAAAWARARGCRQLKVETQNVNVRACRFYAAQGCELGAIHRYGYAGVPPVAHETMLLWYLDL